ncbi:unnamed protein product, partial [Musa acuminata subsp. burmannicoides]
MSIYITYVYLCSFTTGFIQRERRRSMVGLKTVLHASPASCHQGAPAWLSSFIFRWTLSMNSLASMSCLSMARFRWTLSMYSLAFTSTSCSPYQCSPSPSPGRTFLECLGSASSSPWSCILLRPNRASNVFLPLPISLS